MKTTSKSVCLLSLLLLASVAFARETSPAFTGPTIAGQLAEPTNREASGLAFSRRDKQLLWTHNDSGGTPVIYGLALDGSLRGSVRLDGIRNIDWEDIASFEREGRALLLIADTGNNAATRSPTVVHVVAEPDPSSLKPDRELSVRPEYSIHFVFEDGARDCEAVAVDGKEGAVYLLSKRDVPARLYRLPLAPASKEIPATARFVTTLPKIPQPVGVQRLVPAPLFGLRGEPTAMDFAPDGRSALVLVYGGVLFYPRENNETWATALSREPVVLPAFNLPQAEAACFSHDGKSIYVCSEQVMTLLRYDRR